METSLKDFTDKLQADIEVKANKIIKIGGPSCELEVNEYMESVVEEIALTEDVLEEKKILIDKALYFVIFLCEEIRVNVYDELHLTFVRTANFHMVFHHGESHK